MHNKFLKPLFILITVLVVISILVHVINYISLDEKMENTDISVNSELFKLCDYLYSTQHNDEIYNKYSLLFKNNLPYNFFEELGINKNETTSYVTKWGAKYLIASSRVNQKNVAISDTCHLILEIYKYDPNLISLFVQTLELEIQNENGILTNLIESFKLKKFLDVFGESVEKSDLPLPTKQVCYDFINGQYTSIGDIKSAHIFSWRASGIDSFKTIKKKFFFDVLGYIFRYAIIVICTLCIVLSSIIIRKKKKIIVSLICVFSSIGILVVSFFTFDIKNPNINNSINNCIDTIEKHYLPEDSFVYNVYGFDCDEYYGTISISMEDNEKKQAELSKTSFSQKVIDNEITLLYTSVACVRDIYNLPNCAIGIATIYSGNIRISIKYVYENPNIFGPLKYLTFTQYFSKPTIDIEDIVECIDAESISVIPK